MRVTFLAGGLLATALTLAACGGTTPVDAGGGAATGACIEGATDCNDTGVLDGAGEGQRCLPDAADCDDTPAEGEAPAEGDAMAEGGMSSDDQPDGDLYDSASAIRRAEALLGLSEAELDLDDPIALRIGRRGEEQIDLTRDYQLGRMTVELDSNDLDEWVVTAVTVVLPDGPETVTSAVL